MSFMLALLLRRRLMSTSTLTSCLPFNRLLFAPPLSVHCLRLLSRRRL